MISPQEVRSALNTNDFLRTLTTVRDFFEEQGSNPLFVGGVIAKAFSLSSIEAAQIDHTTRTVHVPVDKTDYTATRADGTYDDFDLLTQCPDFDQSALTEAQVGFILKNRGLTAHFVSPEPVQYANWPPRHKNLQFVSGIDVDEDGETHFTFGDTISPPISKETMETWQYVMEDQGKEVIRLPSFNPAVFGLRYLMRMPIAQSGGLRRKDRVSKTTPLFHENGASKTTNKIHTMMKLRQKAISTGLEQGFGPYDDAAWIDFILHLQKTNLQDPLTHFKSEFLNLYWNSDVFSLLATAIAHGWGPFNMISRAGNQFDGSSKKIIL